VVVLAQGGTFGELALTTEGIRSATVVCLDTPTDLAVMSKVIYRRVMGKANQKKLDLQLAFLKQFRIFKGLSDYNLSQLTYYIKDQKLKRG